MFVHEQWFGGRFSCHGKCNSSAGKRRLQKTFGKQKTTSSAVQSNIEGVSDDEVRDGRAAESMVIEM